MRTRRLLLASAALSTVLLGACDKTKKPIVRANDKRPMYEPDAGVAPSDGGADAGAQTPPETEPK